jgi:hypothetical protein
MAAVITSLYRAYCYARLLEMRKNRRRLMRPTRFGWLVLRSLEPEITNSSKDYDFSHIGIRSPANIAFRLMQAAWLREAAGQSSRGR